MKKKKYRQQYVNFAYDRLQNEVNYLLNPANLDIQWTRKEVIEAIKKLYNKNKLYKGTK